jgi:hypothetical protein
VSAIQNYIFIFARPPHLKKCPWSLIISPGKMDRKTEIHKSRSRQYIGRAKDWVEWTLEKPLWRNVRTSRIVCCLAGARQQLCIKLLTTLTSKFYSIPVHMCLDRSCRNCCFSFYILIRIRCCTLYKLVRTIYRYSWKSNNKPKVGGDQEILVWNYKHDTMSVDCSSASSWMTK